MLRNVADRPHAAGILAPSANALGQDLGDDVQSPGRRAVIALGPLVEVDRHACVRARARMRASDGGMFPPANAAGCQPPSTQTVPIVAKGAYRNRTTSTLPTQRVRARWCRCTTGNGSCTACASRMMRPRRIAASHRGAEVWLTLTPTVQPAPTLLRAALGEHARRKGAVVGGCARCHSGAALYPCVLEVARTRDSMSAAALRTSAVLLA